MKPRPKSLSLQASFADTWAECTAAPRFIWENWDKIPQDTDTAYSLEGTLAHKVCECMLRNEPLPAGATPEMVSHAEGYVEFIDSLTGVDTRFVELKMPLYYQIERNAYADFVGVSDDGTRLHIVDYKYGFTPVNAYEKRQIAIYAMCAVKVLDGGVTEFTDDTSVSMHIYQPRVGEGLPSTWNLTLGALKRWLHENVDPAVLTILYPDDPDAEPPVFSPGDDTCRWCPASAICTARAQWLVADLPTVSAIVTNPQDVLDDPTEVVGFAPPETMDDTHLRAAMSVAGSLRKWLDDIEAHVKASILDGKPVEGWKVVEGRGSRQFADDTEAERFLKARLKADAYQPKKLISVAQAEKALKGKLSDRMKKKFDSLVIRREGGPTLVPDTDKRPALNSPEDQFDNLNP